MKFKCGLTQEEENQAAAERRRKLEDEIRYGKVIFAWLPKRIKKGDCRWLENVRRTVVGMEYVSCGYGGDYKSEDSGFKVLLKDARSNVDEKDYYKRLVNRYLLNSTSFIYKYEAIR